MTIGTVFDTKIDLSLIYAIEGIRSLKGVTTNIKEFAVRIVGGTEMVFSGLPDKLEPVRDDLIAQWEAHKTSQFNRMFEILYPTQARAQATMAKLKGEPVNYGA